MRYFQVREIKNLLIYGMVMCCVFDCIWGGIVWVDNGDDISMQYVGILVFKGDFVWYYVFFEFIKFLLRL